MYKPYKYTLYLLIYMLTHYQPVLSMHYTSNLYDRSVHYADRNAMIIILTMGGSPALIGIKKEYTCTFYNS